MKKLDLIILQIDLGRQKETVDYLKHYIDFAKDNSYNAVLLYLEAAVKVPCVSFFSDDETYSPEEIREVVAYGNAKGIDIIPALENLAHVENFLRYENLAFISECKDAMVDGRGIVSGLGHCACVSSQEGTDFLATYYRQVIALFTSRYVHVGMDEPFDFAVCPKCQARLDNGETKADLFYGHLMKTYGVVKEFGRTMMMWDDFFEYLDVVERLPRDIIMCTWNYGFIGDEPQGHWINRKKKDWFRLYDQLGFQYLFCTYANSSSKLYNTDTYTNYASKYQPVGALMTTWERNTRFYLCSYPAIAYTGRLWSGKATEEDKLKIYTEFLGSEEAADIVLNLESTGGSTYPNNTKICENTTAGTDCATRLMGYTLPRLRKIADEMDDCLAKDILQDIYGYILPSYIARVKHNVCLEVFDNYESRSKSPAYFAKKLLPLKEPNSYAHQNAKRLWAKYRPGIKCFAGKFSSGDSKLDQQFIGREQAIDSLIAELEQKEKHGVFYAELMLHCIYGTPRLIIELHYKDKTVAPTIYKTGAKVSGAVNTVRFAMENKPLDYAVFTVYGEGAVYPVHFRYTCRGKKYVVSGVTKLSGEGKDLKKILLNDTQFAQLGNNDGQAHFENVELCRVKHSIKLKFKTMK